MNIQKNNMKPATSQYYVWHPITNKLNRLTADMILLCTKYPVPNSWFLFSFPKKNVYSPAGVVPLPSHLTSCTPTKSNLYLDSSLETVIREPAQYKPLMFHVPTLMSILRRLGRFSKYSIQVWGSLRFFVTSLLFTVRGC
jgi:hypothetical protein